MSEDSSKFKTVPVTAASRPVSAFPLWTSFVPACWARVVRAVVGVLAVLRTGESRARVASARSAEELAADELAHSGLVLAYRLAVLPACDLAPAGLGGLMAHD